MPDRSKDVLGGACPCCYYNRVGHECSMTFESMPEEHLASAQPSVMENYSAVRGPAGGQNAGNIDGTQDELLSNQPPSRGPASSRPSNQPQQVPMSQRRRNGDSVVESTRSVSQDHSEMVMPDQSQSGANQERSATEDGQNLPPAEQDVENIAFGSYDMAWDLVRRARELPGIEKADLLDQAERSISLIGIDPDISRMVGRISELPVERQHEVGQMIMVMLRQFLG